MSQEIDDTASAEPLPEGHVIPNGDWTLLPAGVTGRKPYNPSSLPKRAAELAD